MAEIVIVGAGAAGIATATRLIENGIVDVRILEAENRIGGRIHSVFIGDAFVDLGAEEVHGEEGNILVQLAGSFLRKKTPLTKSICYYSDGSRIEKELRDEVMLFLEKFCEDDSKIQESIGKVFTDRFSSSSIRNKYKNDPERCQKATDFLSLCESFFSILEGPFSWYDAVMESGSHYVDCKGDQFIGWNGRGCKIILDILMKKIPKKEHQTLSDDKIILNKIVDKIRWDTTDKVEIECTDGSGYVADHVIFTPSVGVLRDKHRDIFEPALPIEKMNILQRIGFANVMKVVLKFSKKWWNETPFGFVWSKESIEAVQLEYDKGPVVNGTPWITAIHWLIDAPDNDQVLVVWLTGPATPRIEKLSNDEIKDGVMFTIRKFLGREFDIPEPDTVLPTRWHSNPNFGGTYSYETVEASKLGVPFQTILEQPLLNEKDVPVVLFAGEATHLTQYSTVNGAILSGYREADRLINLYKDE